jgi:hypothetical protein
MILPHWRKRIAARCPTAEVAVCGEPLGSPAARPEGYAWWDVVRLENNLELIRRTGRPCVGCDVDVIVEKDLAPLVALDFDLIVSTEPGGYPLECSRKVGFGACTGFQILKPAAVAFATALLDDMRRQRFGSFSDQVALMHHIALGPAEITDQVLRVENREYRNHVVTLGGVRICVLDNGLVTRDPVRNTGQFANHINIDNVGGPRRLIRYFYADLDDLPLTCRCGQLGDTRACVHLRHDRDVREAWIRGATGWRRTWRRVLVALGGTARPR